MTTKPRTVEEFLAQGGKITKVPPAPIPNTQTVKSTTVKPAVLYTASASCIDTSKLSQEKLAELEKNIKNMSDDERQAIVDFAEADLGYRSPDYATAASHMGTKTQRKKKEVTQDFTGIDMEVVPDELKKLLGL